MAYVLIIFVRLWYWYGFTTYRGYLCSVRSCRCYSLGYYFVSIGACNDLSTSLTLCFHRMQMRTYVDLLTISVCNTYARAWPPLTNCLIVCSHSQSQSTHYRLVAMFWLPVVSSYCSVGLARVSSSSTFSMIHSNIELIGIVNRSDTTINRLVSRHLFWCSPSLKWYGFQIVFIVNTGVYVHK